MCMVERKAKSERDMGAPSRKRAAIAGKVWPLCANEERDIRADQDLVLAERRVGGSDWPVQVMGLAA